MPIPAAILFFRGTAVCIYIAGLCAKLSDCAEYSPVNCVNLQHFSWFIFKHNKLIVNQVMPWKWFIWLVNLLQISTYTLICLK